MTALRSLGHEIQDIAFLLRLLASSRPKQATGASHAIALRAAKAPDRRSSLALKSATFLCLCLAAPRLAYAQAPEVVTPVALFDPQSGDGIRISPGFVLFPELGADLTADSNIYNFERPEISDVFASLRPSLVLASDFSRHALRLETDAEIRRYFDTPDENSESYRINAEALLELGYGIDFEAFAGFARGIERRGTAGDAFFTDEPVAFHDKTAGLSIERTGTRLRLGAAASILKRDYSDTRIGGVRVDLTFRDVTLLRGRLRADYGISPRTSVFAELSGNDIDYEVRLDPRRDSSGFAILAGVRHEVTALLEVEAAAGYIEQDFADPAVPNAGEFNYRLAASWSPRPVWRLTASAERTVDPSRVRETPAVIASTFRLGAERALGDRLLVAAEAAYVEEDYRASPRKDKRFSVGASTTYRLTDRIGAYVAAGWRDQDGGRFGRSYDGVTATVGLRAVW